MTQMTNLQLRVKNVAVMKMIAMRANSSQANFKDALKKLMKATQKKGAGRVKLMRMNTAQLQADGLLSRLNDKIIETQRRIDNQRTSLLKVQRNLDLLTPVSQRKPYQVPHDSPHIEIAPDDRKEE